ncbi:hypothetical protein ScPMuIL_010550 [Solemya velum]
MPQVDNLVDILNPAEMGKTTVRSLPPIYTTVDMDVALPKDEVLHVPALETNSHPCPASPALGSTVQEGYVWLEYVRDKLSNPTLKAEHGEESYMAKLRAMHTEKMMWAVSGVHNQPCMVLCNCKGSCSHTDNMKAVQTVTFLPDEIYAQDFKRKIDMSHPTTPSLYVLCLIGMWILAGVANSCDSADFACYDGDCISSFWQCDGEADCGGGEDEDDCSGGWCPVDFACYDGQCIDSSWQCDGEEDCHTGEDENDCGGGAGNGCSSDNFACHDGDCIASSWQCDGYADCGGGEDENDCGGGGASGCPSNSFACYDGECIDSSWQCDAEEDCHTGEDENDCSGGGGNGCSSDNFACYDGECIASSWLCDGYADCGGGEDENNCGGGGANGCPSNSFACYDGDCIASSWLCDGYADCGGGEDEDDCGGGGTGQCNNNAFHCGDGHCIAMIEYCDAVEDCSDGSDEASYCNVCNLEEFRCSSGECIFATYVCDDIIDCSDGVDELDCDPEICGDDEHGCGSLCIPGWADCEEYGGCDETNSLLTTPNCYPDNIALNMPTFSSSELDGTYVAGFANDGNRDHSLVYGFASLSEPEPWWVVQLADLYRIRRVVIYNRDVLAGRLQKLHVEVGPRLSDQDDSRIMSVSDCLYFPGPSRNRAILTIDCARLVMGQYVKFVLQGPEMILQLAEVEVYASIVEHDKANVKSFITCDKGSRANGEVLTSANGRLTCSGKCVHDVRCVGFNLITDGQYCELLTRKGDIVHEPIAEFCEMRFRVSQTL